ncbi:MAG TPA: hypothetical protein VHS31_03250 [Tepidisphaeraceae bacterium]|nr:hypothetical protein [Tepidisphaeraceae bacterium]
MRFRWRSMLLLLLPTQMLLAAPRVQPGGAINLPYTTSDGKSPSWIIQNGGWLQQRRMNDDAIYAQAGMLMIDQNNPGQTNNQGRFDAKTGEIILDNFQPVDGVQVSRRIQVRRDDDLVRCIDVFKNVGAADASVAVQYTASLNRGVMAGQTIPDGKKAGADLAWVAQVVRGKTAVEIFAGRSAQTVGAVQWEQGSNVFQYNLQLDVPAGKSAAVMHLHAVAASPEKGGEMVNSLKLSKITGDLSSELRKSIVNFAVTRNFIGDREILRGNIFDVVELRSGDSLFGTLQEKSYKLATLFGPMEFPAGKIVGIINVGQFRPRQLLVSSEGEMIGGTLEKQTVDLQLGSGQVTQIPLAQISRVGYRKRSDEPDEWKFDKPMVLLQSGDRMNIKLPDQPIDVMTRFGQLKLAPSSISSIVLQGEDHGVHEIFLSNGSKFAGLVMADQLNLKLASTDTTVAAPISTIGRIQFSPDAAEVPDGAATLSLVSGDMFVGSISGELKLDTTFDTLKIPASQIRGLTKVKESNSDVQLTLWDQTKLSGQLEETSLTCDLGGGLSVHVPTALLDTYSQPSPMPSDQMMEKIKATVQQLNADDWKARDQAQADLVAMGATVVPVLKQLRDTQGPEAQQRIDTILKQFDKSPVPRAPQAAN